MGHIVAEHLIQPERARHPINDRKHVRTEVGLQLGVLIQVIEHHTRHGIPLKRDHNAHAHPVGGFVLDLGDAGKFTVPHLLGDAGNQIIRVDLVGQFGNHNGLPAALLLDAGHAAHADGTAPGGVGVLDALGANDEAGGGEIGALDMLHAGFQGGGVVRIRVFQQPINGVGQLPQVVRGNVGGHAHGNTVGAVHEQVRHPGRQNVGFHGFAVVVGGEIHGVFADVPHHFHGERGEPTLGVPHGGRAVVAAGTKVALAVDQRVAHIPVLGEPHQGVVDSGVAVRVELAHGVRHGPGGLDIAAVGSIAGVVHGVEDAAVDGLQAVPNLRQRPTHNDRHGVVNVGGLHLLVKVDGENTIIITHSIP